MTNVDAQPQKTVLVGVTGGIGAYKSCEIVRGFQKAGLRVKVCMTEHATHFVDPVTFRALTHEKVAIDLFDDPTDPIHHISLAEVATRSSSRPPRPTSSRRSPTASPTTCLPPRRLPARRLWSSRRP